MVYFRKFSSIVSNKTFYVTTPIYYVNAAPHIGHLYSSVIADCIQRWHKLYKPEDKILFSTGTDEHGTKIQQVASKSKLSLEDYCANVSEKYKLLSRKYNIGYTHFMRTTDARHKDAVKHLWNAINKNNHIYSAKYSGWYCVSDETFLAGSQLKDEILPDGTKITVSAESGHPVEWTEEHNYIFQLSSFQNDLLHWLKTNENFVRPKKFHKILLEMANSDAMTDLSVSRPTSRVHWGVPVPGDEGQCVYVWLDALANYLSAAGYPDVRTECFRKNWPPDVQVIGKDILKFHGLYWPSFLMAADLEPPRSLFCHSHWTVEGQKMSKSKNNVVCPFDKMGTYTADGFRYFLLREGVAHSDGNYSDVKVLRILNAELADTLGNLLSRCCGSALNPNQEFPEIKPHSFERICKEDCTKKLLESLQNLPESAERHYEEHNFYKAIDCIIATLHAANNFFETMRPWQLKRSPDSFDELDAVLHVTMETLRVCGILLQPVIPELSGVLLNKLSVPEDERFWGDLTPFSWQGRSAFRKRKISVQKAVLYKRITNDYAKQEVN